MRSFKVDSNPTWLNLDTEIHDKRASQVALVVKNLPANAGDVRDTGSIPESRRSPGEGNGNPLQYSCLENSMGRGAWKATVHRVTESWTQLTWLSMHTHTHTHTHDKNVMQRWDLCCQKPRNSQTRESWNRSSPMLLEGTWPYWHLELGLLDPRTVRQ